MSSDGIVVAPSANTADAFLIESYENQRWYPLGGWRGKLLPTDRWHYSSRDGKEDRRKGKVMLPPQYTWLGDWRLVKNPDGAEEGDRDHQLDMLLKTAVPSDSAAPGGEATLPTDNDGWRYAIDFPSRSWEPAGSMGFCVRRRLWLRRAVRIGDNATGSPKVDMEEYDLCRVSSASANARAVAQPQQPQAQNAPQQPPKQQQVQQSSAPQQPPSTQQQPVEVPQHEPLQASDDEVEESPGPHPFQGQNGSFELPPSFISSGLPRQPSYGFGAEASSQDPQFTVGPMPGDDPEALNASNKEQEQATVDDAAAFFDAYQSFLARARRPDDDES